ncbi:hypothetical protein ARMA_0768 [Ardenticatena maritima]|uniref:Uncharacterized protein n=1 Tax=Ardenticatena maritima TaxID=872965 RepID=A0A0M8K5U4_9CHLR|nr:hypothetical protein ARMA_0768 [Ardenticatena maritima]
MLLSFESECACYRGNWAASSSPPAHGLRKTLAGGGVWGHEALGGGFAAPLTHQIPFIQSRTVLSTPKHARIPLSA